MHTCDVHQQLRDVLLSVVEPTMVDLSISRGPAERVPNKTATGDFEKREVDTLLAYITVLPPLVTTSMV
jgi:hypothetical protein